VNLGGEPERDDSGLPPVDIEIPDDARELDRDVQAYRRELRALRRRQRRMRLHAPLTRDGVVLPLLASCLVLALIAGTLLTVFTAGPSGDVLPGATGGSHSLAASATSRPSSPAASSGPAQAGPSDSDSPIAKASTRKLPNESIVPETGKPVALASLLEAYGSLVIALVPAGCNCALTVKRLVTQVHAAGLQPYLISATGELSKIKKLAPDSPKAVVAEDKSGVLYRDYPHQELTALLVRPGGQVGTVALSGTSFVLTTQLGMLRSEAESARTSSPTTTASPH
jgi:hypothetical protein